MSGATAQKIRLDGLESIYLGDNEGTGNGVTVGKEMAPTMAPQADAPQQSNNKM